MYLAPKIYLAAPGTLHSLPVVVPGSAINSKLKLIMDKIIYNDVYPKVDHELSDSNVGGRKGRSVRDHIFILRSVINDVINGEAEATDIELFDISKCFDEMGYHETHNDLFDAGVRDDRFSLIAMKQVLLK